MNTLKRLLIALAFIAGFSTSTLLADPASHADQTTGEHADKPAKKSRVSRVEKLNAELTLTEEQKSAIAAIHKEENAALKIVSEDKSLERAAKIAKNKEIRAAHAAKIRALLTGDQQLKFDALAAKPGEKEHDHDDKS
jgi:Spy/CpxP family protein refolding chaperone